jgi:RNA polymerase sigma factor for flagellar operon FliA
MIVAIKLTPEELDATWAQFRLTGSRGSHERLVLHYADLVRKVVSWSRTAFPASLEQEDAMSSGMVGLLDALRRFDPDRGFRFETFATSRIRGAIIDELRTMDWVPRGTRAKIREVGAAAAIFEAEHFRLPTRQELSEITGLSVAELTSGERVAPVVVTMSDVTVDVDGDQLDLANVLADCSNHGPEEHLQVTDVIDMVSAAVSALTADEQVAMETYYINGLTLAETGRVMQVPEGRVCALHASALQRVRRTLAQGRAYAYA